jgi:hypothetical protein
VKQHLHQGVFIYVYGRSFSLCGKSPGLTLRLYLPPFMIFKPTSYVAAIIILFSSCGKVYELNGSDWQADIPPSDSVFNREIQILNLGDNLPADHVPLDSEDPMFFSLEKFSSVAIGYRSTERWDIAFSGIYRSEITPNNGRYTGFGYGTSATGGLLVLDTPYDKVTDIPDDSQFQLPGRTGLDDQGFFGAPLGHAIYTYFGNFLRPDKMKELDNADPVIRSDADSYQHMMYCLSQATAEAFKTGLNGKPLRPRTIIIRTAAGNYAKMETQSIFQGILDPWAMHRDKNIAMPVYSFRYIVVKASERRYGFMHTRQAMTANMSTRTVTLQ